MKNFLAKLIFCAAIVFPLMELMCWLAQTNAANVQLTNPLKDVTMDEGGTDVPAPTETPTEEEPLISSTTTGAGEEFDGTKTLNRPLTWWERKLAEKMRNIALNNGWKYAPLEDREKIGAHMITVVTQGEGAGKFAGIYYRDTPIEEWEKQIARALLELARESGGENQSEEK